MTHTDIFYPKDAFSEEMLQSIPKKVCAWLLNIGYELDEPGEYSNLSWSFGIDNGYITFEDEERNIQISWNNNDEGELDAIYSNSEKLEMVASELDFFARLEEDIYAILELCEEDEDR